MKVKQEILDQIIEPESRKEISHLVKTTDSNVYKAMKANADNGILTKWYFLEAISKVLRLDIDEILEDCSPEVAQK